MKFNFFATMIVLGSLSTPAAAASLDKNLETRAMEACMSTDLAKKMKNGKAACLCIAKRHYNDATQEPDKADAERQMGWVIKYYQTLNTDPVPGMSSEVAENLEEYDSQIAADCVASVNKKSKR